MAVTSMSRSSIGDFARGNLMSGPSVKTFDVEYLVIAGGASGARGIAGGGGAGGYRCNVSGESSGGGASAEAALSLNAGTYLVTVGAGGASVSSTDNPGFNGSPSIFAQIACFGGGAGGGAFQRNVAPLSGGSGGGGAGGDSGASGFTGQGFAGGAGTTPNKYPAGGGGGAGSVGETPASNAADGGDGGSGVSSSITGSSVGRAGGGGGSRLDTSGGTAGGATDGGGAGAISATAGSGTANTGGGGGGARDGTSGSGGSGLVVFTVATGTPISFSAGVTETNSTIGGKDVYVVTATSTVNETVTIG